MVQSWTAQLPEHLDVVLGQTVTLPLLAAQGGYDWAASSSDLGVVSTQIHTGPAPAPGDPPSSGAAPQLLLLHGHATGTAEIELSLSRPWQPVDKLVEHRVRVHVLPLI